MNERERGAMSVVMLGVLVVALFVSIGVARLGGALVGRARADSAADAAALAAADSLALGDGDDAALDAARASAVHNGAHLVSCHCTGTTAAVVVEIDLPVLGPVFGLARGRAKAEVRPECVVDLPACE